MKFYVSLQYRMFKRQLSAFGIHPLLGQILIVILFIGFAYILFNRTQYASYLIVLAGVYSITLLAESKRNTFLRSIFSLKKYRIIRLIENIAVALPFGIVLLFQGEFVKCGLLILIAWILSTNSIDNKISYKIVTPFSRHPFEFTVGFRNTFIGILFAYFLAIISIKAGNFNLGIFAMLLIVAICISYYLEMEDDFFIWIYKGSPEGFLKYKLKIALGYCTVLCIPIWILLAIIYPGRLMVLFIFFLLGLSYLIAILFGKYAYYPNQPSVSQAVLVGSCIFFPPLLLFVIPHLYFKSTKSLNVLLS
ncbi:MAG: ABC transporter permease [Saprospiraceae bacterium]